MTLIPILAKHVTVVVTRVLIKVNKLQLMDDLYFFSGKLATHSQRSNIDIIKGTVMSEETIFSKIIRQEIPTPLLYQDELVSAFRDISPRVDSHILIVPNKHIATVNDVTSEDELTLGRMITVARKLAREDGIDESGYRLIINCNSDGGQEVYHIHMHLLGGQNLGPMLSC
jgi:histidine triad (HIT) family protein